MKQAKTTPGDVWQEFTRARSFNEAINLYSTVEQNEDFYIGDQWRGVNAPDLDKPVMNVLARVVKFFISSIVSDDIGVSVTDFDEDEAMKPVLEMLGGQFDAIMEASDYKRKLREVIRNAAVDGDGCLHYWFDPDGGEADPLGGTGGVIRAEVVENTNVHFGNPQSGDVQGQPYLLLHFRRLVDEVKEQAREPDAVEPDEDETKHGDAPEEGKVTVVRKYYKQSGTVWYTQVTRGAVVTPPTDTGLERYPVAFLPWEKVKNQYHGQAAITGLIPNQIFINKLFAMSMQHVKNMAFPKIIYNRAAMPGGWDNRVGAAIPVSGDPNVAVASNFRAQDMSAQVLQMIEAVINYTRDTMGASDAALGNVRPDNTSAIVATQKATSMPLELQKQDFYSFVEESVRIWLDMMGTYYGVRAVKLETAALSKSPQGDWGTAVGLRRPGPGGRAAPDGYGAMQAKPATAPSGLAFGEMPGVAGQAALQGTSASGPGGPGSGNGLLLLKEAGQAGPFAGGPEAALPEFAIAGAAQAMPGAAMPGMPQSGAMPGMPGEQETETRLELFDFASIQGLNLRLNVDIGAATYWSELMQVQTLDNLFANGILQDAEVYLENMPRGYIPGKAELIKAIQKQKQEAEAAAAAQMPGMVPEATMLKGAVSA